MIKGTGVLPDPDFDFRYSMPKNNTVVLVLNFRNIGML